MTPTLTGRWQTRILLLATVGVLVTLAVSLPFAEFGLAPLFLTVLVYVALFGVGWDVLYDYLQKFRWDHDWPAVYQLLAGIWEAVFIAILFKTIGLPGLTREMPLGIFAMHYSLVWLAVFAASQSLMRIIFPRWRFRGGQWW